jgi:uncharacterized membrane protein
MMAMPASSDLGPPARAPRRWLWPLLVASLMLNLLVLGAIAGGAMFAHRHMGPGPDGPRGLQGFVRGLPKERREVLMAGTEREAMRARRRELIAAQQAVLDAIAAEPLDKAALEAALKHASDVEAKMHEANMATFIAIAERMTPQERQRFKEWREATMPPHDRDARRQ